MTDPTPDATPAPPARTDAETDALPRVALRAADGARAEAYRHGAHVTSWIPAGEADDRLYLSARSAFRPGAAIRGGVPVIFPQFAAFGPLPKHGFAREVEWQLVDQGVAADGDAAATFRLADAPATRAVWPHPFAAELTVTVGGAVLDLRLRVTNTGDAPLAFTGALHTYLRVGDVEAAAVRGLAGVRYRDSAAGGVERVQDDAELRVSGEVDRIYLQAPPVLEVREPGRVLRVTHAGFPDVVVWNPGAERAAALPDLEPGGHRRLLCVEAAVVGTPVRLAPGARWDGRQTLVAG